MLTTYNGRVGWDPFHELRRMQTDMNRLFDGQPATPGANFPPVNIYAKDDGVLVTAELPGFDDDAIDITVRDDTLTIAGELNAENDNAAWHRRERGRGRFSRAVDLPFRVDPDHVKARFADGVLEIEMKRPEQDKPRRIAINA